MTPSVGRIVHYRAHHGGECHAAVVVRVLDTGNLNLSVFEFDGSVEGRFGIEAADPANPVGGQWHWPERVDEAPTLDTRSDAP